jgi:hypothetical protein
MGDVVAGSAFATLQSAGAGGAGIAVVNGVVQSAGVLVGSVTAAARAFSGKAEHKGPNRDVDGGEEAAEGPDNGSVITGGEGEMAKKLKAKL